MPVARDPEPDTRLPFLLRLPLGDGLVLKARDTWPRTSRVYCHRVDGWPDDAEVLEELDVVECRRRGVAVDLVLDRRRENRSQFVFTTLPSGREGIIWQTRAEAELLGGSSPPGAAAATPGVDEARDGPDGAAPPASARRGRRPASSPG